MCVRFVARQGILVHALGEAGWCALCVAKNCPRWPPRFGALRPPWSVYFPGKEGP